MANSLRESVIDSSFKVLSKEEICQLSLQEQLKYQKKYNKFKSLKQQTQAVVKAFVPEEGTEEFKELTPEELGKLDIAAQL